MDYSKFVARAFTALSVAFFGNIALAEEKLEFNRDVRPILFEYCVACHGPDSLARKADLRLDEKESAYASGAVVPGDVSVSNLLERIFTTDPDAIMPPPASKKEMKESEKEILKRWISEGAEYQDHWAFIAPTRPAVPKVNNENWVKNPIDNFVLAKLESMGMEPAPEADRYTLIRRASLDIRGVPPTPEEINTFIQDHSANAYEKMVDRFLESEQYGEHRAKYWLDAARYADTHGIHFDNYREMWTYRDWVISAYNRNMPFDQFTIEQLAGDLLPTPTLDQKIATGFNRCNITTNEGGVIAEEYLVHYTRDRTETVSQVWLGLTANCSTCHDHKFDKLSQKEFYEMAAFFNNTSQGAMDGNIKDTPPIIPVPLAADRPRFDELVGLIPAAEAKVNQRKSSAKSDFDAWAANAAAATEGEFVEAEETILHVPFVGGEQLTYTSQGKPASIAWNGTPQLIDGYVGEKAYKTSTDSSIEFPSEGDFDATQPFSVAVWVRISGGNNSGAILGRMDESADYRGWDLWLEGGRVGSHIINKWQENALKAVSQNPLPADKWVHVCISYDGSQKADGLKIFVNGAEQGKNVQANSLSGTIKTQVPLKIGQRNRESKVNDLGLQDLRIYSKPLTPAQIDRLAKGSRAGYLVNKPAANRTPEESQELFDWWLLAKDTEYAKLQGELQTLKSEQEAIRARGSIAHIANERGEPAMAYVLFRGEYDKRRDEVRPKTPALLPAMAEDLPRNRLGFAKWLLTAEHPLTARVTVNRFWQEVFGTGIVKSSGDFGIVGELPSNQALLDWLAVEFREKGWNVKDFYKLMLTSATYRQAANATPAKLEKDPENRLLARGPRFRLEAEMIRDYALAASGTLTRKIGGPSVKPYQPEGVWEAVAMIGSNTRDYRADSGESLYRRSLYTFWKRSAPPASMEIFNAPNRETCIVRRERTNTPLQALVTLNDPQFIEAAKMLAENSWISSSGNRDVMLDDIALRVISRPLRMEEKGIVNESLNGLLEYYSAHESEANQLLGVGERKVSGKVPAGELAAWTMLVNELFNLDEVVSK